MFSAVCAGSARPSNTTYGLDRIHLPSQKETARISYLGWCILTSTSSIYIIALFRLSISLQYISDSLAVIFCFNCFQYLVNGCVLSAMFLKKTRIQYNTPLSHLIKSSSVDHHLYGDDTKQFFLPSLVFTSIAKRFSVVNQIIRGVFRVCRGASCPGCRRWRRQKRIMQCIHQGFNCQI